MGMGTFAFNPSTLEKEVSGPLGVQDSYPASSETT